ncbi:DUF4870 family protein [Maricaulis sp. CAU 1757]
MTDQTTEHPGGDDPSGTNGGTAATTPDTVPSAADRDERLLAGLNYVLYLIGNIIGFTSIIAVIIAYVRRENAPAWLQAHYTFQIRTFWISLISVIVFGILTVVLIGFVGFLLLWLWLLIRAVVGLLKLIDGQPIADPRTFWI